MTRKYIDTIVKHYESCLDKHGDSHLGVDWPKQGDAEKRYEVMLDVMKFDKEKPANSALLDFGCGAAHLYQYILDHQFRDISYAGLDISEKFISLSKSKFPSVLFYQMDILDSKEELPLFDYIIMNGVFTEKRELSFEEMWEYFCKMLNTIFSYSSRGIAFNVMSKAVEWEREDLFHVPADRLISFLVKDVSRNFIIRNDYGLYEFTTYVYK
jgi:SAM-dependent methyltransferase